MPSNTQQRLLVETLLLQREALYARVYAIEQAINERLGDLYPFPPPPEPVATGAPPKKTVNKARTPAKATPKLRPLESNESAYRVCFQQESSQAEENHVDRKSLQSLLQSDAEQGIILSIDTLDTTGQACERLYERPKLAD